MLRFSLPVAIGCVALVVVSCNGIPVDVPGRDLLFHGGPLAKTFDSYPEAGCDTTTFDCRPAQFQEQVPTLTRLIKASCQNEACGGDGDATAIVTDDSALFDRVFFQCASGGTASILSGPPGAPNVACWNCTGGCGVPASCPSGSQCGTYVLPGLEESDCTSWECTGVADGWALHADNEFVRPVCRRLKNAPPPQAPETPTTIASVVNGHPSLTWNASARAVEYVIYRQLDWQTQAEAWHVTTDTSYTDINTNVIAKLKNPPFPAQWVIYTVTARNSGGESGYYWLDRWSY